MGDLRFDLAHLPLEGLVLEVGLVAAVQGSADGIVRALVLAAEAEQAGQAGFELLGQRQPFLDLGRGPCVGGESSQEIVLE